MNYRAFVTKTELQAHRTLYLLSNPISQDYRGSVALPPIELALDTDPLSFLTSHYWGQFGFRNAIRVVNTESPIRARLSSKEFARCRRQQPMKKTKSGKYQPSCTLAHELINQLSVIVGNCDLLKEDLPGDSEGAKRLFLIKDVAKSMAEDLQRYQTQLDVMMRTPVTRNPSSSRHTRF